MNNFIKNSPTTVRVGRNEYTIFRDFGQNRPVIQMIAELVIEDEETGLQETFRTPTPGWKYEKINKEMI